MTLCAFTLYADVLVAALVTIAVAVACNTALVVGANIDATKLRSWWSRNRRE